MIIIGKNQPAFDKAGRICYNQTTLGNGGDTVENTASHKTARKGWLTGVETPLLKCNQWGLSREALAKWCKVLFVLMLIPLVLVALYNYPADDDFAYTAEASVTWVRTHSPIATIKAILAKMTSDYLTHFGLFMHPIFNATNALIFDLNLYFLNNWYMLALVCLLCGYLLKGVLVHWLGADKSTFWIVYTALMILVLQFMPCIGEGVYWHAGSNHTFSALMLLALLGLLTRCHLPQSRGRAIWRIFWITVCCACVGAVEYSTLLGGTLTIVLLAFWAFTAKSKSRPYFVYALVVLAVVLLIFAISPGNAIRQDKVGEPMNPVTAVIVTVLDSFDLAGKWLSPHLFAMLMLIIPAMWKPLKESKLTFKHPLLWFITGYGLFSAAMVPGVYSTYGYDTGRYLNVLWLYFLLMVLGSVLYLEGSLIRWLEKQESEEAQAALKATGSLGQRYTSLYLALCLFFLGMGGFSVTIMNTSSISATKSMLTGEAASFRRQMAEREEYIRVTDSDVTEIKPIMERPYVFKDDKLPWQGKYGAVRYMKYYFEVHYFAEHPEALQQN